MIDLLRKGERRLACSLNIRYLEREPAIRVILPIDNVFISLNEKNTSRSWWVWLRLRIRFAKSS